MKINNVFYLLLFISLSSCFDEETNMLTDEAQNYLSEILDIMEQNSINKQTINWSNFRTQVLDRAAGAQTIQETFPAIREALVLLGDNHSSYTHQDGRFLFAGTLQCELQDIVAPSIPSNIGYVTVNSFGGSSSSNEAITYAEEIQNQIMNQDNQDILGWIVDLRNNGGGNMYPMIAGSGSLIGEGIAGYFIGPDNTQNSWGFSNNASTVNGNPVTQLTNSIELKTPNPKVAVLLNNGIASSGEVMAISFIGRENTKSFGKSTCGLSTANSGFTLSDNSKLNLTVAFLADRNKNLFGIPINPDLEVGNEDIIQNAIEWIEN